MCCMHGNDAEDSYRHLRTKHKKPKENGGRLHAPTPASVIWNVVIAAWS